MDILRIGLVTAVVALSSALVGAQDEGANPARVAEILRYVDARAENESAVGFDSGDYTRTIQIQRIRFALDPHNETAATDLIFMLGNVEYKSEELSTAVRFRLENPQNPDRGLPEAQIYFRLRSFARIPGILEADVDRVPAPHANTFRMLAHAYDRLGFFGDALRVWELAVKSHPEDGSLPLLRDRARQKAGG